ncbi:hypothetical protein AB1Y20_017103 [Prymnesium parvum]|uniref:Nucleotide-diphospho-sugar transferase domain-containing protein n=1 Tax=Prymnesium parvum TaxID=97485 RepID=A0AB34IAI3_PRYPA
MALTPPPAAPHRSTPLLLLISAIVLLSAVVTLSERVALGRSSLALPLSQPSYVRTHEQLATFTQRSLSPSQWLLSAASTAPGAHSNGNSSCVQMGDVRLAQGWFERGWRRTLPHDVAREACWYAEERTLDSLFVDVEAGGVVWLGFSNAAFRELSLNWVAHVYRLRKERQLVVAALDRGFSALLLSEGVPHFEYDWGVVSDMRSNVSGFRRLGALKAELVLKVLRARRHVLLSDVDVAWLTDPEPILRRMWRADVMSATDCLSVTADEYVRDQFGRVREEGVNRCAHKPGNRYGHAAFNTGVLFFRATVRAIAVAAAWRHRLLSVQADQWLDDQLAFNELVWHGFRNNERREVKGVSSDGRVIQVQMVARRNYSGPPPPQWGEGWRSLARQPESPFIDTPQPSAFNLAPLPSRYFCSGHLFWEQQGAAPMACSSVHTTFVEGGNLGKIWRFREAALWLLDPPEYFNQGAARVRFLSYSPPIPSLPLPPAVNASASKRMTDKYKAGWKVPDALNLSPRIRAHLELLRRQILALRDALAVAYALNRTLILPRIPCLCDRSEAPTVIHECIYEASELSLPFDCPLTHIFDIFRFQWLRPDIDFREAGFLANPLTPRTLSTSSIDVSITDTESEASVLRTAGRRALARGSSDIQLQRVLGSGQLREAELIHLESTEGIFGGWVRSRTRATFETIMRRSGVIGQASWCCTSWYKPSGTFFLPEPVPTLALRDGCGTSIEVGGDGPMCAALQARRRADQAPFPFIYEEFGRDGYYRLVPPSGSQL